ncbi:MAG: HD domain-containing protein [Anaerolineae bacterium]|nr:HD domain-containing protein [Anaerolineae bacterium]
MPDLTANCNDLIFDAIEFAAKAHRGHYRKSTKIPYFTHPLSVAKLLIEAGCEEELAVAGLLHDTIEDTSVTLAQIEQVFGKRVARLVQGLSEPDRADTWENRKQHTIDYLKTAPLDIVIVACADKLDNIRSMRQGYAKLGEPFWERFNRPKEKQAWYYGSLAEVFTGRIEDARTEALFTAFQAEIEQVFG